MARSENAGPGDQRSPIFISSDAPESTDLPSEISLTFRPPSSRPSSRQEASLDSPAAAVASSPAQEAQDYQAINARQASHLTQLEELVQGLKREYPERDFSEFDEHLRGAEENRRKMARLASNVQERLVDDLEEPPAAELPASSIPDMSNEELRELEEVEDIEDLSPQPSSVPSSIPLGDPRIVNTADYVYAAVFDRIKDLYEREPDHPMFGEIENGKIRCPLGPLKKPNEVSWAKKIRDLARNVASRTGDTMLRGSCWMWYSSANEIIWQKKDTGRYASIMPVRLLCFVANPSRENWAILTDEKYRVPDGRRSKDFPFCHTCHNGQGSLGEKVAHCINGIEHGFFGTSVLNNSMKSCAKAAGRWCCPGHGPGNKHCKWVNKSNGSLLPCRNQLEARDRDDCDCEPNCFD